MVVANLSQLFNSLRFKSIIRDQEYKINREKTLQVVYKIVLLKG